MAVALDADETDDGPEGDEPEGREDDPEGAADELDGPEAGLEADEGGGVATGESLELEPEPLGEPIMDVTGPRTELVKLPTTPPRPLSELLLADALPEDGAGGGVELGEGAPRILDTTVPTPRRPPSLVEDWVLPLSEPEGAGDEGVAIGDGDEDGASRILDTTLPTPRRPPSLVEDWVLPLSELEGAGGGDDGVGDATGDGDEDGAPKSEVTTPPTPPRIPPSPEEELGAGDVSEDDGTLPMVVPLTLLLLLLEPEGVGLEPELGGELGLGLEGAGVEDEPPPAIPPKAVDAPFPTPPRIVLAPFPRPPRMVPTPPPTPPSKPPPLSEEEGAGAEGAAGVEFGEVWSLADVGEPPRAMELDEAAGGASPGSPEFGELGVLEASNSCQSQSRSES